MQATGFLPEARPWAWPHCPAPARGLQGQGWGWGGSAPRRQESDTRGVKREKKEEKVCHRPGGRGREMQNRQEMRLKCKMLEEEIRKRGRGGLGPRPGAAAGGGWALGGAGGRLCGHSVGPVAGHCPALKPAGRVWPWAGSPEWCGALSPAAWTPQASSRLTCVPAAPGAGRVRIPPTASAHPLERSR